MLRDIFKDKLKSLLISPFIFFFFFFSYSLDTFFKKLSNLNYFYFIKESLLQVGGLVAPRGESSRGSS